MFVCLLQHQQQPPSCVDVLYSREKQKDQQQLVLLLPLLLLPFEMHGGVEEVFRNPAP